MLARFFRWIASLMRRRRYIPSTGIVVTGTPTPTPTPSPTTNFATMLLLLLEDA